MELLIDREIVGAESAFAAFGDVRLFDGRALGSRDLGAAEVLLVRSVSRVDRNLLDGSRVRFVGTSTAGTDHVDVAALARAGIGFAAAAGCNARAVAEHVLCCIVAHADETGVAARDLRVGIVGYGHVGRALGALLDAAGLDWVVNDPPLGDAVAPATAVPLDEALGCDVVTLHVPLTAAGRYPTRGLLDADRLARLRPGALLINAARGGVVDEAALAKRLAAPAAPLAAIDCWQGEPAIGARTLALAWQASPHIAGHTLEARVNASALLHAAVCEHLGAAPPWPDLLAPNPLVLNADGSASTTTLLAAVQPLASHSARMRELAALPARARAARFDSVRRRYGLRREFASYTVAPSGLDSDTVSGLGALGFRVGPTDEGRQSRPQ